MSRDLMKKRCSNVEMEEVEDEEVKEEEGNAEDNITKIVPFILQFEIPEVKIFDKSLNDLLQNKVILKLFHLEEKVKISHVKNVSYFYVQRETICKSFEYLFENINQDAKCRELEKKP